MSCSKYCILFRKNLHLMACNSMHTPSFADTENVCNVCMFLKALKGQSQKVCEIMIWDVSFGLN
jgi:hypothetical protein